MLPSPKFHSDKNIIEFNGALISLHCHHYNCGLLKTIEEIPLIDGHAVITETATEEFFVNFRQYLFSHLQDASASEVLREASELYRFMGLGRLDLSGLTAYGGIAYADSSYYVTAWLAKYGRREAPVCYLTCGFIAGTLAAMFDLPLNTYEVTETQCMIGRHTHCEFVVSQKQNVNR